MEKKYQNSGKKPVNYKIYYLDDSSELGMFKIYIERLMEYLWPYPEAIFYILKNSGFFDFKDNLANFIVNNFYSNKLSSNYMGNNLLYVFTMMFKDEIEQLENLSDLPYFFENSRSSVLLSKMVHMPDIQMYFKKILFQMIEKIENVSSSKKINFNMDIIMQDTKNYIESEKKRLGKKNKKTDEELTLRYINSQILEQSMNTHNLDSQDVDINDLKQNIYLDMKFNEYGKSIEKSELEKLKETADKSKKKILSQYYSKLLKDIKQRNIENLFHVNFLQKYSENKDVDAKYLLSIYQKDFLNVISFLEIFIDELLKSISLIPNSIKYICKIIMILFKKKFQDITKIEENAILSKFFVEKLLIPILNDTNSIAYMNEFFISGNTLYNIEIVSNILEKLLSFKLFQNGFLLPNKDDESFYTYFNRFILEQSEKIIYFFQKMTDCTLPQFIEKYIDNLLPNNYLYDYFTENPEEIYASISICFKIDTVSALVSGAMNSENELLILENEKTKNLKGILNKLSEEKMDELRILDSKIVTQSSDDKIKTSNTSKGFETNLSNIFESKIGKKERTKSVYLGQVEKIYNYYIYNFDVKEGKYQNLFKINNKIEGFYIDVKVLKEQRKLDETEISIIKLKNYLVSSLINYTALTPSLFKPTDDIISIFNQMYKHMVSTGDILDNAQAISFNWAMRSILNLIEKIPVDYKQNDYEKFFLELTHNIEKSIEELNFEKIFIFKKKKNNLIKLEKYYENYKKLLDDTCSNNIVKDFVEKSYCPVEVIFRFEGKDKIFELKKSNINKKHFKELDIIDYPNNDKMIFKTVSSFTKYFPDLNIYQDAMDVNPLELIKNLNINSKLFDYFDIIKSYFIQEKNCKEETYNEIYDEKIENYVMNKIYKKIYPKEIENDDSKLFEKTMHLSWVEPQMMKINGEVTLDELDKILPEILEEFKKLNKANSPFIKFNCLKKIFDSIKYIINFNDEGEGKKRGDLGADDITPYLNYVLIRACPVRILSDFKYIDLFKRQKIDSEYNLFNIKIMCDEILNSTYDSYGISENEYIKRCNDAITNNKSNNAQRFNEIIDRFEIYNN